MTRWMKVALGLAVLAVAVTTVALQPAPAGPSKLVLVFVPSQQTETILFNGSQIARMLTTVLGIPVEGVVSTSYTAAVEAMCAGRADIGALNPFSYVLAHQKCGVEVAAISVRFGLPFYLSQINVGANTGITKVEQLQGKRFAFVDPASTSGYLFPSAMLKKMGYDPDKFFGQTIFAGSHPNVILAIYRGQVDGGASFQDARLTVQKQFPDVRDKVTPIAWTDPIPNDTWSVSASLPPDLKAKVKDRLLRIARTEEGKEALKGLYSIEGLTDIVELTDAQVQQMGVQFPPDIAARITRKGDKQQIPVEDWYFKTIRDAARLLGLDLQKLAQ